MTKRKNIIFRLKNGLKPISWQLPYSTLLLPKLPDPNQPEVKVHYIPGAKSIYVDDYKGQEEPHQIVFEDGELEVRPNDVLLLELCRRHPWFGKWYEEVNEEADANLKLKDFQLRDLASDKLNAADDIEIKAIALAVIGYSASDMSAIQCKAQLKEIAYSDPNRLLAEMDNPNYANKYIAALAFLKEVVRTNESNTAIIWTKSNTMIVRVAIGENPLEKLTEVLSGTSEESAITLQTLGELVGQSKPAVSKTTAVTEEVVSTQNVETPEQIEARVREEFEKKYANYVPATPVEDVTKAEEDTNDDSKELTFDPEKSYSLEELQKLYPVILKNDLPPNKKNDAEWLLKAITKASNSSEK